MAPFPSPTSKWHTTAQPSASPRRPELSAKGKTVLVTGGGSGIGAETARYFAAAGASRIALLGRREQPLHATKASIEQKYAGVEVRVASADVTKKSEVDAAFAKVIGTGQIHVVVSNAALTGTIDAVKDVDADQFIDAVEQNLRGALFVAQAFLRYAAPDAVAIEVNSNAAHINYVPKFAAYSVAKLAVYRLWDSFAFANPDIRVFHTQPGVVNTSMNQDNGGIEAVGSQDDVSLPGSFHLWLASDEARFLRGKYLYTNWDIEELKDQAAELETSRRLNIDLVGWPFQEAGWKFETKNSEWLE